MRLVRGVGTDEPVCGMSESYEEGHLKLSLSGLVLIAAAQVVLSCYVPHSKDMHVRLIG